ncbi:MAG: hypothetical protein JKY50_09825 [Oleispira sp.]|nr:hypothetical protein [Oleispira sp.]MBL4880679.1 hypothetical protein [Oleispira sp.]
MTHPKDLFDKLEQSYDLNDFEAEIFTFMLRSLERFKNKFPDSTKRDFEVAQSYRLGNSSEQELKEARLRVWKFLDQNRGHIGKSKESILRALIFTLYPHIESDSDAFEWVDWFIGFSNACTSMETYQCQLIREIFSEQLRNA